MLERYGAWPAYEIAIEMSFRSALLKAYILPLKGSIVAFQTRKFLKACSFSEHCHEISLYALLYRQSLE